MNRLAWGRGQARPGSLSDDIARSSVYVMKLKKIFIFYNARLCKDVIFSIVSISIYKISLQIERSEYEANTRLLAVFSNIPHFNHDDGYRNGY